MTDPDWKAFDFKALQSFMENQRGREPRVSVPTFRRREEVPARRSQAAAHQMEPCLHGSFADSGCSAWTAGLRAFAEDSKQDRVFEELLFWVITRELQCFY